MALANSLVEHPAFNEIAPFIKLEMYSRDGGHRNPRRRIELVTAGMDQKLLSKAIGLQVKCCRCGKAIHPFRSRNKGLGSRVEKPRHVYIAVACTLDVNIGCSRGKAAKQAYKDIEAALYILAYEMCAPQS